MGLAELLEKYVPTTDPRCRVPHAKALGMLLRSIVVEREPIYRAQETVHGFATGLFGIASGNLKSLSDDRLGRALDRLFEADRAALLTEVVLAVAKRFAVQLQQLHNDSTSISFCGQYRDQSPSSRSGKRAPAITYGYSKQHRPDLKQLLFILTTDADGGVPVQFRTADGNTNDSITHIETWNTLRTVAGRADFLYVADSKLCSQDNLSFIDRAGGRFVTVMPRSRREDKLFHKWLQTETPSWELVWDRPSVRHRYGPRDVWSVYRDPVGSAEGFVIIWVWSTLLTLRQQARRHRNIATAIEALTALRRRILGPRSRVRGGPRIDLGVELILEKNRLRRYLKVKRIPRPEHTFKQTHSHNHSVRSTVMMCWIPRAATGISRFPRRRHTYVPRSLTAPGWHDARDVAPRHIAFCYCDSIGTREFTYAAQYLTCMFPCQRFTDSLAATCDDSGPVWVATPSP